MKRFLTPHQWRVVMFIAAAEASYKVLQFFVRRAAGWDTKLEDFTDNPALNLALSAALHSLLFASLVALFLHYGWGEKAEKGRE